jgi:tRNA threonylcarbamoyladenosine biosynthesis protein TsaB
MLDKAGVRASDLGGVVIGLGPGSFTGLRIGLATVKGVCYAAQVPLLGASSLAAMAVTAAPEVPEGTLLVPCLDARKGEVYCGFYRKKRAEVVSEAPEMALAPQALIERIRAEREAKVFGIGREAYPLLRELPPPGTAIATPDAAALVSLVREIGGYSKQSVFALEPHYVRPSDSEWTLKKRQPKQSLPTED